MNKIAWKILIIGLLYLAAGCSPITISEQTIASITPESPLPAIPESTQIAGLSPDELATLNSLERVDKYPLYTMQYHGVYQQDVHVLSNWNPRLDSLSSRSAWSCSLFAAFGSEKNMFYGRNFDWRYSPALLLFTDPPDGYASVSMVDIGYLVPSILQDKVTELTDLSVQERQFLLDAPAWPFDGMNDQGLVVGMAAVMDSRAPYDPAKPSIDSLEVIRLMLDQARNMDEAVTILDSYNVEMGSVPIHYLIADRSGRAVLVEFNDEMVVIPNDSPWHLATNHLRVNVSPGAPSGCWRYDRIEQLLTAKDGDLTSQQPIDLLQSVSQDGDYATQWSIVYGIDSGLIQIAMGQEYDKVITFQFDLVE